MKSSEKAFYLTKAALATAEAEQLIWANKQKLQILMEELDISRTKHTNLANLIRRRKTLFNKRLIEYKLGQTSLSELLSLVTDMKSDSEKSIEIQEGSQKMTTQLKLLNEFGEF